MPFKNFLSAPQDTSDQFDKIRTDKNKFGSGIDAIWGIKGNKSIIKSIRFAKDKYDKGKAQKWLKDHGFKTVLEGASMKRLKDLLKTGAVNGKA